MNLLTDLLTAMQVTQRDNAVSGDQRLFILPPTRSVFIDPGAILILLPHELQTHFLTPIDFLAIGQFQVVRAVKG